MENRKVRRKTFAARQDLIERASKLAKQKGYSLYAFINEILQLTFEAEELGVSFRILLDERLASCYTILDILDNLLF